MSCAPSIYAKLQPGSRISGRYDLRDNIGAGAFGTVWEAYDLRLRRLVAVKVMPISRSGDELSRNHLQRFRVEAQSVAPLSHPGIVTVYDFGEAADFAWLVMELVIGETLKAVLDRGGRPPLAETVRVVAELLEALHHAHARDIVHRDVKPANVLLSMGIEEGLGQVKLADFGIAHVRDWNRTQQGEIIGTPAAMAPEQWGGEPADRRTDLWAVGLILYQLLTGRRAFLAINFASLLTALNDPLPAPSSIVAGFTPAFDPIVAKALAMQRDERYADARAMGEALRAAFQAAEHAASSNPVPAMGERAMDPLDVTVRIPSGIPIVPLNSSRSEQPSHAPEQSLRLKRVGLLGFGMLLGLAVAGWSRDTGKWRIDASVGPTALVEFSRLTEATALQTPNTAPGDPQADAGIDLQSALREAAPSSSEPTPRLERRLSFAEYADVREPRNFAPMMLLPANAHALIGAFAPSPPTERAWRKEEVPHAPLPTEMTPAMERIMPFAEHYALRDPPASLPRILQPAQDDALTAAAAPSASEERPVRAEDLPRAAVGSMSPPSSLFEVAAPAEAAANLPQCPPTSVAVRAGSHANFGRLVFDWRRRVQYDLVPIPGGYLLRFRDVGCAPPVARLVLPHNIRAVAQDITTGEIRIETAPGTRIRRFRLDGRVILDVRDAG